MATNLHEGKVSRIRDKIKNFFKKVSNDKDSINVNPPISPSNGPDVDSDARHLYRDDLKMY